MNEAANDLIVDVEALSRIYAITAHTVYEISVLLGFDMENSLRFKERREAIVRTVEDHAYATEGMMHALVESAEKNNWTLSDHVVETFNNKAEGMRYLLNLLKSSYKNNPALWSRPECQEMFKDNSYFAKLTLGSLE